MGSLAPLAVGEKNAAQLLDLKLKEFLTLVEQGILPKPKRLGDHERWDTEELRAIFSGEKADNFEDVRW